MNIATLTVFKFEDIPRKVEAFLGDRSLVSLSHSQCAFTKQYKVLVVYRDL